MAMDPMPTNQLINSHVIFTRVGVGLAHTVQVLGLMCLASSSISISISFHGTNYLMLLLFQLQLTNHRTTLCQKKKKKHRSYHSCDITAMDMSCTLLEFFNLFL